MPLYTANRSLPFALCLAMLILAGCGAADRVPDGFNAERIDLSDKFSNAFTLTNTDGQTVTEADFRGKPAIVYFGFTHCPDICPNAVAVLSAALNELGDNAENITPIFIGVDYGRDTPQSLKKFLAFDPRIEGLAGSEDQIRAATTAYRVFFERRDLKSSSLGYTIDHSSMFYFVDREGTLKYAFRDNLSPQQLADFLKFLMSS